MGASVGSTRLSEVERPQCLTAAFLCLTLGFADMSGDENDSVIGTELVAFEAWVNQMMVEHSVV